MKSAQKSDNEKNPNRSVEQKHGRSKLHSNPKTLCWGKKKPKKLFETTFVPKVEFFQNWIKEISEDHFV